MPQSSINQNPEQIARDQIDAKLAEAGWRVQDKSKIDFNAGQGIAVREYPTDIGPADYVLFVDRHAVGVIEAKPEDWGHRITVVEEQAEGYAAANLKWVNNQEPLPFVYQSTGVITRFTDGRDPHPRSREVFTFHRPETMAEWLSKPQSLRARLQNIPPLDPAGFRACQITAIKNLENSFKADRPRALMQMATGSGKTFTAISSVYRLLKHADAKRILFAEKGDIPFIKVYNLTFSAALDFSVNPTFVDRNTHERFLSRSKVYPDDVLMNIVGPPLGKVSIVPSTYPEWNINQAIAFFRTSFLRPKLLAAYLAYEGTVRATARKAKATAGQFNLTLEICREIPIPVFDPTEQLVLENLLDEKISVVISIENDIEAQLAKCEALRQSILKKAFSGQLVAQDPTDEPASELLKRIRAERNKADAKKQGRKTKITGSGKTGKRAIA